MWILAGVAVLLVVGLVIALVIVTSSSRESTVAVPVPPVTGTSTAPNATSTTRIPLPTTSQSTLPTPSAVPTAPLPGETTSPTGTDTVVYTVDGEGRAINVTYVDTGGIMQTEFNVLLPWSKEVSLTSPARGSASVAVVNVGRDVTCSVTVNGVQVRQRSGRGLTICTGAA
ncbi:MmpS family transport accessory protein [Mycobacterium sp. M26]|uniref:MmpS family transport accessory protein n=1 Tax=Mycobacterium sp. M26 TaxID=1762962 RepID=UPI000A7E9D31